MHGRHKIRLSAGKIDIEPAFCFLENRYFFFFMVLIEIPRIIFFAIEPETRQSDFIRCQENFP